MARGVGRGRWKVAAAALLLDLLLGEPSDRWHPVVWMGRLIGALERRAPREGAAAQLAYGAASEAMCLGAALLPACLMQRSRENPGPALGTQRSAPPNSFAQAVALKPTLSVRALFEHVGRVERALSRGDLEGARKAAGMIVSRPVEELDEPRIAAAAVESLAENASDSVVAPLFYYGAFGLPGAYCYRMANTLDAMWGYRGSYEYLGKVAARLDDLLNLIPSRLTAVATVASCGLAGGSPSGAWRAMRRDGSSTASPNAGRPMAAVAGALGVRLEKVDHYTLNAEGREPEAIDVIRARRVVGLGLVTSAVAALAGGRLLGRLLARLEAGEW